MIRLRAIAVIGLLAITAFTGSATAATVSGRFDPGGPGKGQTPFYSVSYTATSGERNDLELTLDASELVFRDRGATLSATSSCTLVDEHTARCPREQPAANGPVGASVTVLLGDGDDRGMTGPGLGSINVHGDAGNDQLRGPSLDGGPGDDTLTGTSSGDLLRAGPGADTVLAGDGDDTVDAADGDLPGADRLDAGNGTDTVNYGAGGSPTAGVTLDLAAQQANGAGEGQDIVVAFENAGGSTGPDLLSGTDEPNRLSGGGGNDRLVGRAGDDRLAGGAGRDALDGGAGDDLFVAGVELGRDDALTFDDFHCGDGNDAVKFAFHRDLIRPDCESLDNTRYPPDALARPFNPQPRRGARGRLTWAVTCTQRPCRATLTLLARRAGRTRPIAATRRTVSRTRRTTLTVRLDARAQRLLRLAHRRVQVKIDIDEGDGYWYTTLLA